MGSGRMGSAAEIMDDLVPASRRAENPVSSERLQRSIDRARNCLLSRQTPEGYWVAELEGDTILESEYVLLLAFLGRGQSAEAKAAAAYILDQQCPHGGWAMFPGGPLEISGSVKAYLALKITGHSADSDFMVRARRAILAAGGIEKVNSFTRYYLAMLGLIPYNRCPAVPPEMILLPDWAPFNIYEMSSWSRTIVIPLSLLWAFQPETRLPESHRIDELYASPDRQFPRHVEGVNHEADVGRLVSWTRFFRAVDSSIKFCERMGWKPLRKRALQQCEQWIVERLEGSDGLGAIFPPIIWSIIGLRCLGYADDHPVVQSQFVELDKLCILENDKLRLQPCKSPVWDTAIAVIALRDAGVPRQHPAIAKSIQWLLDREIRRRGDWARLRPDVEASGWAFEFNNEFYPDFDDTCMVLIALSRCLPEEFGSEWTADLLETPGQDTEIVLRSRCDDPKQTVADWERVRPMLQAIRRGVQWLRAMQSKDGGWGAFDADNTKEFLTKVPFADHNAMIDPSWADITARIVESLACVGVPMSEPFIQRALQFVWDHQEPDHSWFGRWGVNYIYGTWQVLVGLRLAGIPLADPRIRGAVEWLKQMQQPCGGWGETALTYDKPELRGTGNPTPSQTAWAVLGLMAAGETESEAVRRGIGYLVGTQRGDGDWDEVDFTGTGFPRVFYLRYHGYRLYFPLMALGRYATARNVE
ncbi:terpene cyclase/mutase family protein [Planctellipticum variicoloris]|uniref:terpene cyclase/mutase family protein n=1 Tax=Planctellipticum variicoloris TaxID=3064265 RepID=UPI003013D772|nr:terpene cyclase/mutase family protein [Planctomycetaceae bacterium SH412]